MRVWRELVESAGLSLSPANALASCLSISALIGLAIFSFTAIIGLALAIALLVLGILFELIRSLGSSRQRALEQIWPGIFDLLRSGAEAGLTIAEQLEYLAEHSPAALKEYFAQLSQDLERGVELERALARFQSLVGSRSGDFLVLVLLITSELGGRGEAEVWAKASSEVRQEQQLMNQVRAKQGWVLGSAKLAVLAPWLIVFVLLSLEQNREAYATNQGSLVLLLGLGLSSFAYFLTSALGRLPLPGRVFHVG
jgi:tight adherence protein B